MAKAVLDVLSGVVPDRRPVWLMRQAGRYLPEYRQVRQRAGSFLDLCYDAELAAEVTLQPLRRYGLDAAIVFADILLVPHALGCTLDFVEHEGPVLSVIRNAQTVNALSKAKGAWQFNRVYETLARVKEELSEDTTLIGFCGAPWTVASYMVEGRGSDRALAISAARADEVWFRQLIDRLVAVSVDYLVGQVDAGADVLQIFDSWAGDLPEDLRPSLVHEPIGRVIEGVRKFHPRVPVIVFGRGVGEGHIALAKATGANAVSVEEEEDIGGVLSELPANVAFQGNLSPAVLLEGGSALVEATKRICGAVPKERHIFNLGHGIMQYTPPENVALLLETVRAWDERPA